jgi:hypothetical protein
MKALALLAALATPAGAWDLNDLNKRADENLVQVGSGCSGTLVSVEHRLILTAYHCIAQYITTKQEPKSDEDGELIVGDDGKPVSKPKKVIKQVPIHQMFPDTKTGEPRWIDYWANIVARDSKLDVAILQIPEMIGPLKIGLVATSSVPLEPRGAMPQRGADVWHIGNPRMQYGTVTKGVVSSATRNLSDYGIDKIKYYIQYDGGLYGGSSGGALYDDKGTYLGITVMYINGTAGEPLTFMGLIVPMEDIWTVADAACLSTDLGGTNPATCPKVAPPIQCVAAPCLPQGETLPPIKP